MPFPPPFLGEGGRGERFFARVAVLTPAGTGAIATVAVAGPGAWAAVRTHFRPASGKPLPDDPPAGRVWFGTLGDGAADEVVVAVTSVDPEPCVEVHSHGGRRVVRWVVERFTESGCVEVPAAEWPEPAAADPRAVDPLTHAPTLRTASILLDQYHGAFRRAAIAALAGVRAGDGGPLRELARFAPVGRHLVEPWRVVVAGPPNVGKSSLVNALAGYQRAIVSPVAGTTRDAVAVSVAFDGWPVELTDTAGLRDAAEELEAAGIGLAKRAAAAADLTLWVVDASDPDPVWPDADGPLVVVNKTDRTKNLTPQPPSLRGKGGQSQESEPFFPPSLLGKGGRGVRFFLPVSALTGDGITALGDAIARALVPDPPPPGAGVPFTPALADAVERAAAAFAAGDISAAEALLVGCLDGPG